MLGFRFLSFDPRATPSDSRGQVHIFPSSCRPQHPGNPTEQVQKATSTQPGETGCCSKDRHASALVPQLGKAQRTRGPSSPLRGNGARAGAGEERASDTSPFGLPAHAPGRARRGPDPDPLAKRPTPYRAPADKRVGVRVAHEGPQLGQEGRDVAGPRSAGAHGQIHAGQGGERRRYRPRREAEGRASAAAASAARAAPPPPAAHTRHQGLAWPPPSCDGRAPAGAARPRPHAARTPAPPRSPGPAPAAARLRMMAATPPHQSGCARRTARVL